MRVLWVEDFGDGWTAEELLETAFCSALSKQRRVALADHLRRSENKPSNYRDWRKWQHKQPSSDEPEIDVCRSNEDFDQLVGQCGAERYEAVLLDVNLTNDFFISGKPVDNPEKGGFWLYNKLIRQGFPSSRISLLTAYGTTADITDFRNDCERFGHDKIEVHAKTGDQAGQWVKKLAVANFGFLILRRGVLDGIDFCESLLDRHGSDAIRYNNYVRVEDRRWTLDHAKDFLYSLRHLLPDRLVGGEMHLQLRGFLYVLCREWDSGVDAEKGIHPSYKSLGRLMKAFRNMTSHGRRLDDAHIADIAFYVLSSLRASFLVPGEAWINPESYELRLMSIMGDVASLDSREISERLADEYCNARSLLKSAVAGKELSATRKDKHGKPAPVEDKPRFEEIVNELANIKRPVQFDFLAALRNLFIHTTLQQGMDRRDYDTVDLRDLKGAYEKAVRTQFATIEPWARLTWEHLMTFKS